MASRHFRKRFAGLVEGKKVLVTSRRAIADRSFALPPVAAGLECVILIDDVYAASFRFTDAPRKESPLFVGHLKPRHAVNRVIIVSGDRDKEVQLLAAQVGVTEVHSAKSPEEKVEIVREESRRAPTLFLGDGINDAPAMQAATVGVAFGVKSDITLGIAGCKT